MNDDFVKQLTNSCGKKSTRFAIDTTPEILKAIWIVQNDSSCANYKLTDVTGITKYSIQKIFDYFDKLELNDPSDNDFAKIANELKRGIGNE